MRPHLRDGRIRKGVFLLPSLFTFGNIILGFYACVRGLRGDFQLSAVLIVAAGFADALDGRIARMTRTESAFGREFDSLADIVTFGFAPAFLAYLWGLQMHGRLGWLLPVFFLLCAATRLARFNVQSAAVDSGFFVGLPTPAAAAAVMSLAYYLPADSGARSWHLLMMITLAIIGLLMVSTFRYLSLKQVDLSRPWSYRNAILLAAFLLLVVYNPPAVLFSAAIAFALSGPTGWLVSAVLHRRWRLADLDSSELDKKNEANG